MTKAQLYREQLSRVLYAPNLSYFVAVTEAGSIREASRRLRISPSAVSRQIFQLEQAIGMPLFDRIGSRLRISDAGRSLLRHCTATMRSLEETVAEIDALQELHKRIVHIGTVESAAISLLPGLVKQFAVDHPQIRLNITTGTALAIADNVLEGRYDIGITFNPRHIDQLTAHLHKRYHLGAVVAQNNPLARAEKVSLAECFKFPLVLPAPGMSMRATIDLIIADRYANEPLTYIETNSLTFMNSLVSDGKFIAIQTGLGVEESLKARKLNFVELSEPGLGIEELFLITRANATLNPTAQLFLDHAIAALRPILHA